jgi:mono/diheme cytochrome c family protein
MMPYDWFLALEQPNSDRLFGADGLGRFGYLPNPDKTNNPDGLPVGFVKDSGEDGDWFGLTCAACHTGQMRFGGKTLQIDGGPTDADMWAFISEMGAALAETSGSDAKFKRFADRVRALPAGHSQSDAVLRKDLQVFAEYFAKYVSSSKTDVAWGRARLDAFGMIFNRATGIDLDDWSNTHPPNAPVSYPFLWDTDWHNKVQWNGSAPNRLSVEKLGRNVGEVLGVFARTEIKKTLFPPLFFKSTAKRTNQVLLEQKLSTLRSPAWQELVKIDPRVKTDPKKVTEGATLYRQHCYSCHAITPRDKPLGPIEVTMTPLTEVGTDPMMAQNAATLQSKSGILEGVRMPPFLSDPIAAQLPSFQLTAKIVTGAILAPPDWEALPGQLSAANKKLLNSIKIGQPPADGPSTILKSLKSKIDVGTNSELWRAANDAFAKKVANTNSLAYKARPLDGIWATAPYLHNGSVPNLYQLLLPAKDRMKKFYVGTRDFDPVNVGFATDKRDGAFEFDTSLPGNSNAGHDAYGTDTLTDEQRWQLVEYLKTL